MSGGTFARLYLRPHEVPWSVPSAAVTPAGYAVTEERQPLVDGELGACVWYLVMHGQGALLRRRGRTSMAAVDRWPSSGCFVRRRVGDSRAIPHGAAWQKRTTVSTTPRPPGAQVAPRPVVVERRNGESRAVVLNTRQ